MPRDKRITLADKKKAIRFFERALQLQRDMYDYVDRLKELGREDLAQQLEDGAFEMDLTWNNAEKVAKEMIINYITVHHVSID